MTDKDFDKIFREKLEAHSEPVDGAVWAAIEGSLAAMPVVGTPVRKSRKVIYYISSVAAVLLVALFFLKPGISDISKTTEQRVAVVEEGSKAEPGKKVETEVDESHGKEADVATEHKEIENLATLLKRDKNTERIAQASENKQVIAEHEPVKQNNQQEEITVKVSENSEAVNENQTQIQTDSQTNTNQTVSEKTNNTNTSNGYVNWNLLDQEQRKGKKGYSVSLLSNMVSPGGISGTQPYVGSMAASGLSHTNSYMQSMDIVSEPNYSLPVNVGVQAQIRLNHYLSLGLGVGYTWLGSEYEALVNKKAYSVKQHLHYIGIPLNVYITLLNKNNLYFYANLGGAIEKGLKAKYELTSYDDKLRENATINGFQYSVNAGIGLEYRFIDYFGLYLEPNVAYYFDSEIPASIRTEQPLQIKGEVGLRFHIR